MRDRRRLREAGVEPPFGDPGITIRECRDPEVEATKLVGPRVAIIRSAREGRQLLERLGADGGSTSRLPRNRALERARLATAELTETAQMTDTAETADVSELGEAGPDEPVDGPPDPEPDNAPIPLRRDRTNPDLDSVEIRLRVAAVATTHWALQSAHAEEERLIQLAFLLRRAIIGVAAVLAMVGVALLVVRVPATIGLALLGIAAILVLVQRLHRAEEGADEAADAAVSIEIGLLADHGLLPTARADLLPWATMLARNGLPPMGPELVEEAVEELRRRDVRPARVGPDPVPRGPRAVAGPARSTQPPPEPGPGARRSDLGAVDLVVVVDDGLYVGHRLALKDVSDKLAARVPLLVLATNERLWQPTGRTR